MARKRRRTVKRKTRKRGTAPVARLMKTAGRWCRYSTPLWLMVLLIGGGIFLSRKYVEASTAFRVQHVSGPAIQNWSGPDRLTGRSMFRLDIAELAAELKRRNPSAKAIRVIRQWPDTVRIEADARQPVAQLRLRNFYPVDNEGFVFSAGTPAPQPDLPIVEGFLEGQHDISTGHINHSARLRLALALVEQLRTSSVLRREQVTLLSVADAREIMFRLREGIEVRVGDARQLSQALEKLDPVLTKLHEENLMPRYIDLRFADPVIGPR